MLLSQVWPTLRPMDNPSHAVHRELRKVDLRWTALNRDVTSIYLKTSPRAGWIGEAVAPSGEAVKSWLVALSRDATLNQVGFDARRVDGENWVIRASAPNDSRAALFKERVRLLTGTKWCWDSYENMSFKDMVNSDHVSVASGIYASLNHFCPP